MNLWKKTNAELMSLATKYQMEFDPKTFDRKDYIPQLTEIMAQAGDLEEPVMIDEEGDELKLEPEEKTFVVRFFQQEGQPNYVSLGHNGCCLYLPREVKWRLPIKFLNVLNDAVTIKIVPDVDSNGRTKGVKEIRVPSVSYQIYPE